MKDRGVEGRERVMSLVEARRWIEANADGADSRASAIRRLEELLPESKSTPQPVPPLALRSSPVTVILRSPNRGGAELVCDWPISEGG
jgi:hypothetical protein